jgi:hypothetical protein
MSQEQTELTKKLEFEGFSDLKKSDVESDRLTGNLG